MPRGDSFLNTADRIQEQLLEDGHLLWGLVIYRCTYSDDAAWVKCLNRLRAFITRSMRFYSALDLLREGHFQLTVFEDTTKFDGAGPHMIRQCFKEWRSYAFGEEQGPNVETEIHSGDAAQASGSMATRYRFCVQIDEATMQSIVKAETPGEAAWVNLIQADWDPNAAAVQREEDKIEHEEMGLDPEDFEATVEFFPEIDGCIEENIGWMRVQYQCLIPRVYADLRDPVGFDDLYRRPPDIGPA